MKAFSRFLGITCVAAAVSAAHATDYITYNGNYGPDEVLNIQYNKGAENLSVNNVVAGFLQFNDDSNQDGLSSPFESLCGDIFHDITGGDKYIDTIYQTSTYAATGPAPSSYTTAAAVEAAGNIVGKEFDTVYNADNNAEAGELQVAVWATLYDTAYTNQSESAFASMLTNTGAFTVSGSNVNSSFLNGAYGYWKDQVSPTSNALFLLHGSTGFQGQDQFTTADNYHPGATPEPFTIGIGIAGAGLAFRRRLKARTSK